MRIGIIVFPGVNCDRDCAHVLDRVFGVESVFLDDRTATLDGISGVILPGGFAHGDYLRPGAIAARAPVMRAVARFAGKGGVVWGICNGFQILLEAGLLPGVLLPNRSGRFLCKDVFLRVERPLFDGCAAPAKTRLRLPIAHAWGNYHAPPRILARLRAQRRIVLRYVNRAGEPDPGANPNGSIEGIAGICNAAGNVVGIMPHPERCAEGELGNLDGARLFRDFLARVRASLPYRTRTLQGASTLPLPPLPPTCGDNDEKSPERHDA
ncbi:MAG: phosphoribosylformylglycinamidine synthase subunit PurQ [Deltaproteobacteria bacterium]|nr:MAG: phosphoribosylformylglycinamidine synthase subunit PurQ [Deltaproteobacteria bacterium]